jgi:DNA-binding response OmpR family regulator
MRRWRISARRQQLNIDRSMYTQHRSRKKASPRVDRLRFSEGPKIQGHVVQHSEALHLLIIDGVIVTCSPTEYRLLMRLLQHVEGHVPFEQLMGYAYASPLDGSTRRNLTQHMSRVRAKLWPFDLDILCITGYGYTLLVQSVAEVGQKQTAERRSV